MLRAAPLASAGGGSGHRLASQGPGTATPQHTFPWPMQLDPRKESCPDPRDARDRPIPLHTEEEVPRPGSALASLPEPTWAHKCQMLQPRRVISRCIPRVPQSR